MTVARMSQGWLYRWDVCAVLKHFHVLGAVLSTVRETEPCFLELPVWWFAVLFKDVHVQIKL